MLSINELMLALSRYLGIPMAIADQDAPDLECPFVTYAITKTNFENPHQSIRKQFTAPEDNVEIEYHHEMTIHIQLKFYNKERKNKTEGVNQVDELLNLSRKSWIWLNEEGKYLCKKSGVLPVLVKTEITESNKDIKEEHSDKISIEFNFGLKSMLKHSAIVEIIKSVDYKGEVKI